MEINSGLKSSEQELKRAKELVVEGGIRNIIFSGGTYQIEVVDEAEEFWIFLQIDDEGKLIDQFCTCEQAEKNSTCEHLAAGMLAIFREFKEPLHLRFILSLWNKLFQMTAKRCGYFIDVIKGKENRYSCFSKEGKKVFFLHFKTDEGKEKADEWIVNRKEETEETSLKFSNLDPKELRLWKEGRPSEALQYELSLWSDLAKWMIVLEDSGNEVEIHFKDYEKGLPKTIAIQAKDFDLEMSLAFENWPQILSALAKYQTEIKVFPFKDLIIEKIQYDEKNRKFLIHSKPFIPRGIQKLRFSKEAIEFKDWIFYENIGFFPKRGDEILKKGRISEKEISSFLQKYSGLIEDYLHKIRIHRKPIDASYQLFFDGEGNLHIQPYLFEKGDLTKGNSYFFEPWAYLEGDGFYRLSNLLFKGIEKVIPRDYMPEFIERNKLWLNKFDEFKIHLTSIESKLTYEVVGETLNIKSDESFLEKGPETIDFDRWIYLKGYGFFSRGAKGVQKSPLLPKEVSKK